MHSSGADRPYSKHVKKYSIQNKKTNLRVYISLYIPYAIYFIDCNMVQAKHVMIIFFLSFNKVPDDF